MTMNEGTTWLPFVLIFASCITIIGSITILVLIRQRRHKKALMAIAARRGWQWRQTNEADYLLEGQTEGIRWQITGHDYDMKVMWHTTDVPPIDFHLNIISRKTADKWGFGLALNAFHKLAPQHFSGREKVLPVGSAPFRARYALLTDNPASATYLTPTIETFFVKYPAQREPISLHYNGKSLYLSAPTHVTGEIYDPKLINSLIRGGNLVIKDWHQLNSTS